MAFSPGKMAQDMKDLILTIRRRVSGNSFGRDPHLTIANILGLRDKCTKGNGKMESSMGEVYLSTQMEAEKKEYGKKESTLRSTKLSPQI